MAPSHLHAVPGPDDTLTIGLPVAALDQAIGPIALIDGDGRIVHANPAAAPLRRALRDTAGVALRALILGAIEGGAPRAERLRLPGDDGEPVVLDLMFVPLDRQARARVLICGRDTTYDHNMTRAAIQSRQLYKDLVGCSADFAWETDSEGRFNFVSRGGALGYDSDDLIARPAIEIAVDGPAAAPIFQARQAVDQAETWLRRADGEPACVRVSAVPATDRAGRWQGARGVCRDITEAVRREQALSAARAREELTARIVEAMRGELDPETMFQTAAGAIAEALDIAGCWILRADGERLWLVGQAGDAAPPPFEADDLPPRDKVVDWRCDERAGAAVACSYRDGTKGLAAIGWDGRDLGAFRAAEVRDVLRGIGGHLGIAMAQAEAHEQLRRLSRTDELTGLMNRRAFDEEVARRIEHLRRVGRLGAVVYVDLDNFKPVNDRFGHATGDEVLRAVAEVLSGQHRPGDLAARLGGDEFAMWLEEVGLDGAVAKAEHLLADLSPLDRWSASSERPLSASIGIALADPTRPRALDVLLRAADAAMYRAKGAGKARIVAAQDQDFETDGENA